MSKIGAFFRGIGDFLSTNLYAVLAAVIILMAIVGYGAMFSSSIGPAMQNEGVVQAQLELAKKTLVAARQVQQEPVEGIRTRAADALATRVAYQGSFFTESEAAQLVDALYMYAATAGVMIVDIQASPVVTQSTLISVTMTPVRPTAAPPTASGPTPTGRPGATPAPTGVPPTAVPIPPTQAPAVADTYRVVPLRVLVQGPSYQLVQFASKIREAQKSLVITNLAISAGDARVASLNMDLSLYISALNDGYVPVVRPTQVALGAATPAVSGPPVQVALPPAPTPPAGQVANLPVRTATVGVPGNPPAGNPPIPPPPTQKTSAPVAVAITMAPIILPSPPSSSGSSAPVPTSASVSSQSVPTSAAPRPTTANVQGLEVVIQPAGSAVSLPYTFFTASTLLAAINAQGGHATQVDKWNGSSWQTYQGQGSSDFKIEVGAGYVVRGTAASTWTAPQMVGAAPRSLHLDAGWWLIGVLPCKNGGRSCYTASSFAKAVNDQGGGVTQVSKLQNGQWVVYNVGAAANDFQIVVGQAYFVRTTKASDWTP